MPNINFINGQVVDPVIKRADVIVFKVPVEDDSHIHFEVRAIPLTGERGRQWIGERRQLRAQAEKDRPDLVRAILTGKLRLSDVDPNRVDYVMLEDEIAQTGQGAIAVRSNEHLGRSDRGVFLLRKIWGRELRNLAEKRPTGMRRVHKLEILEQKRHAQLRSCSIPIRQLMSRPEVK